MERFGHSLSSPLLPTPPSLPHSLSSTCPSPSQSHHRWQLLVVVLVPGGGGSVVKGDGLGWGRVVELDKAELGLDGYGG